MRTTALMALILVGCGPVTGVLSEPGDTDISSDDTAADTDTDVDTDADTDADTDTDTDVEPDLSEWVGGRQFYFPDIVGSTCTADVTEEGINITDDGAWDDAVSACMRCEEVYWIEVEPERICGDVVPGGQGYAVSSPVIRGLDFIGTGGEVMVYAIREGWNGWNAEELAEGTLAGVELTYSYDGSAYGAAYTATGFVDFD